MTVLRTFLFSSLLAATLSPASALAACPTFPEPEVVVNAQFSPPRYNFQQSLARLRQIAEVESAAILHKDQPVGLAVGELSMGIEMKANAAYGADGATVCARPARIDVNIGFTNNTIYVAKELPRRTCGHQEVLAHEEEHVRIDRALLRQYEPVVQQYMQIAARQMGTVRATTTAEAENEMQKFINKHLETLAEEMNQVRKDRQAAHDSHDEYARLAKVCDGQVQQLIANTADTTHKEYNQINRRSAFGYYPSRANALPSTQPSWTTYSDR
jgi:hypothetical protein